MGEVCCPRAALEQSEAPPSPIMKSRRLIGLPPRTPLPTNCICCQVITHHQDLLCGYKDRLARYKPLDSLLYVDRGKMHHIRAITVDAGTAPRFAQSLGPL
jgi:hypothetical protein